MRTIDGNAGGNPPVNGRICAVLVTFNRKILLRTCLASLLKQTRPLDQILIVDNASTDGTPDLLQAEFPQIPLMRLERNSGGAGGFHHGMKRAYDEGFDWIWVLDDDVEMVPTALEGLLGFADVGDLITPVKVHPDGPLVWEALWNTASCYPGTLKRNESFANGKSWTPVSYANFEGALIRRTVIERSGLPDIRYFVGGDDTMYGLRAHFHTRVIYANTPAVVKHLHSQSSRSKMGFYLQIRNRFLNFEHFRALGIPVSRPEFLLHTAKDALRDWGQILFHTKLRTIPNFAAVWNGFFDGLNGKFGPPPWL